MLLTDQQIAQLRQTIADYHTAFVINYYGPQTVPPEVVRALADKGLVRLQGNTAQDAYLYGRLLQQLNTPQAAQMTFAQFQNYLRKNPIPLSPIEEQAVRIAASRGAQYVVGLGNTVAQDTGRVAVEADAQLRRLMKESIKTTVAQGIAERQTVKDIKSNLGHLTKDWTRDLDRIAATETSLAMNEGVASQVREEHGDDSEVSVRSRRGCCPECEKAYKGIDGAPIIFRLSDLEANGTNYKRKKADKLPVVPPYHPNCVAQGTLILTAHGLEPVEHITPGTLVYTHLGRLQAVTHVWSTWHTGKLVSISGEKGPTLSVTGNHPVHNGLDFVAADTISNRSAMVRVSHVVQPPYIEDNYLDRPRAAVMVGHQSNGSVVTALILPCGTYTTGAIYDDRDSAKPPLAAALSGRLTFQSKEGIPALGVSDFARLADPKFFGKNGCPIVFARQSDAQARAIEEAYAFFSRDFSAHDRSIRCPGDLLAAQASAQIKPVAWVSKIELACRQNGVAGYELAPALPEAMFEGRAELVTENVMSVSQGKYKGFVYNLTVANDSTYIANGAVVHNCACALVHVPKGHGYTDDNRMSPFGKRGIRPHADTAKSMLELGERLSKADGGQPGVLSWFGLRLKGVKKLNDAHYRGKLVTPTGTVPCLINAAGLGSDAYVAHLPSGDHVMLGFPHAHAAAVALNAHHPDTAMMTYPGHGPWSSVPAHELASWSAPGPDASFLMGGVGQSPGAVPEAQPLLRAKRPKKDADDSRPIDDARLVLPVEPPKHHVTPLVENPYDVLPDLAAPAATIKVKKVPKTAPWATAPKPRDVGHPTFVIGQEGPPDPEFKALVANTARRNVKREPIEDIEVGS